MSKYSVSPFGSPGGNTPQSTNNTATYLPSRKLSKLDDPDIQDTSGEVRTSSYQKMINVLLLNTI